MSAKPLWLFSVLLLQLGCSSCPPCEARAATCPAPSAAATPPASTSAAASVEAPAGPPPATPAPSAASTPVESPPSAPGTPARALPEVKVENVGLHVGGGPNDDATKKPFLATIELHFDEFRACYVKVEEPEKGGTFGVDLHIGKSGGKPEVKQPRTGMKGAGFRDCVVKVFENLEFDKPKKGPTVISYSIKYSLVK